MWCSSFKGLPPNNSLHPTVLSWSTNMCFAAKLTYWHDLCILGKPRASGEFERNDDWWIGYVEELPGANTQRVGRSRKPRENPKDAVAMVIEANRELTLPPCSPLFYHRIYQHPPRICPRSIQYTRPPSADAPAI
uniref:Uncharacterized protein n=1 Tax=Candidatus Methanophaga sp. ANME-1 ERB7 TaxID=2759913 RepID=A0A7G9Z3F3_9EURY|nr:hypothetical protein PNEAJHEF_00011 [Methanosarcinales archaeon ANME-1 ERB7]